MKHNLDLQKEEILKAYRVYKEIPSYMDSSDLAVAKASLKKKITMEQAFAIIDIMTYPYNAEMKKVSERLSVANIVLDRAIKQLGLKDNEIDTLWKDAKADLDKANKEQIKKLKSEYRKMVRDSKKDAQKAEKEGKAVPQIKKVVKMKKGGK